MNDQELIFKNLAEVLHRKFGKQLDQYLIPPPVFTEMQGEIIAFDLEKQTLEARYPVQARYLNPYRAMQGGMIGAAVDNTLGPLSLLVAPPNVTRRLELTYSRPATPDMEYILVKALLVERQHRKLTFRIEVTSPQGEKLARGQAEHWIVDPGNLPVIDQTANSDGENAE